MSRSADGPAPEYARDFPPHNNGLTTVKQFESYAEYLGTFIASWRVGVVK
jgi:hypothetical protein